MDEKSKKKKKLKQKQKQRQKQNQTVIVNVNSVKSTRRPSKPQQSRVQIPPPIHKVYASPIHDLTPQMFNKEGKQASQPTLAEQIEKYLKGQEQAKQGDVLGSAPATNLATAQTSSPKKSVRPPLRPPPLRPDQQLVIYAPSDTDIEAPQPVVRLKPGRKLGSKNKPTPRAEGMEFVDPAEVMGIAEVVAEPAFKEKNGVPDQLPDEFFREQLLLRPSQNPDNMSRGNRFESLFNSPRDYNQPINANTNKKTGRPKKQKNLVFEE